MLTAGEMDKKFARIEKERAEKSHPSPLHEHARAALETTMGDHYHGPSHEDMVNTWREQDEQRKQNWVDRYDTEPPNLESESDCNICKPVSKAHSEDPAKSDPNSLAACVTDTVHSSHSTGLPGERVLSDGTYPHPGDAPAPRPVSRISSPYGPSFSAPNFDGAARTNP